MPLFKRGNLNYIMTLLPWNLVVKIAKFTSVKFAMFIFINNIPVSIRLFFHHLHLVHKINQLVVLIQLDFENRLIQRNWTFTLGLLGLVLNNASSFGIAIRLNNKCYVKCKYNKCRFCYGVPHTKFAHQFFWLATS